jgi:hypothetical protein
MASDTKGSIPQMEMAMTKTPLVLLAILILPVLFLVLPVASIFLPASGVEAHGRLVLACVNLACRFVLLCVNLV